MKRVVLRNFRQNAVNHPTCQPFQVYAELHDLDSDQLIISATVNYILEAIVKRRYKLVSVEGNGSVYEELNSSCAWNTRREGNYRPVKEQIVALIVEGKKEQQK